MPSEALASLKSNLTEVDRLFGFHRQLGGESPGRRQGFEVINKSAVVLTCACWEAFIEDLCIEATKCLTELVNNSDEIPQSLRVSCFRGLNIKEAGEFWKVAVDSWQQALIRNAESCAHGKKTGDHGFNTPSAENITELFKRTIDLNDVTQNWRWQGITDAKRNLKEFLDLRGQIVHRVSASAPVQLTDAEQRRGFIETLGEKTDESVRNHLLQITQRSPW